MMPRVALLVVAGSVVLLLLSMGIGLDEGTDILYTAASGRRGLLVHLRVGREDAPRYPGTAKEREHAASIQHVEHETAQSINPEDGEGHPIKARELEICHWSAGRSEGTPDGGHRFLRHGRASSARDVMLLAPHMYIRYSACLGLANQVYSHIIALALAARMGADVILAPATYRSSFKYAFNSEEAEWKTAPASTLLDETRHHGFLAGREASLSTRYAS